MCATLERACLLLEELGDPNHGAHVRGGTGARAGAGGGVIRGPGGVGGYPNGPGPPGHYDGAAGAVPPLGNYGHGDHHRGGESAGGGGGGAGGGARDGWITPLSPKNYYELHMRAMDEMPGLEEYLLGLCRAEEAAAGAAPAPYAASRLYETVQYCPRVVPRLYLQICTGAVSVRAGSVRVLRMMTELAEAAKSVQCPVRGLFLRYYLLMTLKDKLPDGSLDGGGEEGPHEEGEADTLDRGDGHEDVDVPSPPPADAGEEMLEVSEPTAPPPALPPPPPPSTDGPLFGSTPDGGDASLFSDLPLTTEEEPSEPALAPPSVAPPVPTDRLAATSTTDDTADPDRAGTVVDSCDFILANFFEMNRLWIRIQHMPAKDNTKETKRRTQRERNDLRILVGSNLNRLSQLEGLGAHEYGSKILPRILQEVAGCRDPLAQAYLMDCIIQVFPDEFHLETLEVFLGVCPKLREKVNVRTILNNMMERLLHYYQKESLNDEEDTNDVKAMMALQSFDMFEECVQRLYEARGNNIPPRDVIRLQLCLLKYALAISPGNAALIRRCIAVCASALTALRHQKRTSMQGQGIVLGGGTRRSQELDMEERAVTALGELLSVPLESMGLGTVLKMPEFGELLGFLPRENQRKVAVSMAKSVIGNDSEKRVKDANELEQLLTILAPLLRDAGTAAPITHDNNGHNAAVGSGGEGSLISRTANLMGTLGISPNQRIDLFDTESAADTGGNALDLPLPNYKPQSSAEFQKEQELIAKLVHTLDHGDTDMVYQMLNVVRRHLQPGGAARITITLPSVVFEALGLLRRVQELEFPEPTLVVPPIVEKEERQAAEEKPIKEDKLEELGDRVPEDNGDVPEKPKEGDTMEGTVVVPAMIEKEESQVVEERQEKPKKEDKLEESGGGGPEGHVSVLEKPKKEDDLEGSGDRVPEKNGDMPEKMEVKTESLKNSDAAEDTIKESDLIVETRLEKSGPEKDSSFKKDKEESAGITCGEMQEERTTATTEVSENTVSVVAVEEKVNAGPTESPAVTEATTEQQQSTQLLFPAFTKSVK